MMEGIKEESVAYLFNSQVDVQASPIVEETAGELPAAPLALGHVPGNGAPGPIEDSVAPAGAAPAGAAPAEGAPAQRTGRRGTGGRGSRGRHAKGAAAQSAGAQPQADRRPSAGAPGAPAAPAVATPGLSQPRQPDRLSYSAPTVDGEAQVQRRSEPAAGGEFGKVGRNAPCPCGSGRKYKLCHGDPRNRPAG
jgi:preprotein translocase subunit SecA